MEEPFITHISKIRSYQLQQGEVAKAIRPNLESAINDAERERRRVHRVAVHYHEERTFVCSIQATVLQAQAMIFMLLPTPKFFEAVAYDPNLRIYYFFSNHIFEQYAVRMNIEGRSHLDILYHYAFNNPFITFKYSNPHEPEGKGVTACIKSGIIYGAIQAQNIFVFKTFISHFTLNPEKQRQTRNLRKKYFAASRTRIFSAK